LTGLALALSLAAQACVADVAGDENEIEGTQAVTASQVVETEELQVAETEEPVMAADRAVTEVQPAAPARRPGVPETVHSDLRRDVPHHPHGHKPQVIFADPPPYPW
jgi:hypothetical protein